MNWKYLSYSVSLGVAITALSSTLYNHGGEFFLWPGMFMELLVTGLMLFIIQSDDYYSLPSGAYLVLNTLIYSLVIFMILFGVTRLGSQRPPARNGEFME